MHVHQMPAIPRPEEPAPTMWRAADRRCLMDARIEATQRLVDAAPTRRERTIMLRELRHCRAMRRHLVWYEAGAAASLVLMIALTSAAVLGLVFGVPVAQALPGR